MEFMFIRFNNPNGCIRLNLNDVVFIELSISGVSHLGINPQIRQITTDQRKVVIPFKPANSPDPLNRLLITDMATQRVRRICRISDDTTLLQDLHGLMNQAVLRIYRMYAKKLAHLRAGVKKRTLMSTFRLRKRSLRGANIPTTDTTDIQGSQERKLG